MNASDASLREVGTVNFESLRAKLEVELARPVVIAITSSTDEDGKEIVARGLADSLASTGYRTLFIDACLASRKSGNATTQRQTLEEAGRRLPPDTGTGTGKLAVLSLGDILMQKSTNQRHVQTAFGVFRSKFDYVVIDAEFSDPTAFSAIVIYSADAVLSIVKKGRRRSVDDIRLANALKRIGKRFLGAVVLDPLLFTDDYTIRAIPLSGRQRRQKVLVSRKAAPGDGP